MGAEEKLKALLEVADNVVIVLLLAAALLLSIVLYLGFAIYRFNKSMRLRNEIFKRQFGITDDVFEELTL